MKSAVVAVGIDLGTSHSSATLARGDLLQTVPIEQIESPALRVEADILPSQLYLPIEGELEDQLRFEEPSEPWVAGAFARERSVEVPDRVVVSSKSWLCATHVDRQSQILPWQSELSSKISPVAAAELLLKKLLGSVSQRLREDGSDVAWSELPITVTVPASFDEVARQLTQQAAQACGIKHLTLLEEPQAAFYAWLHAHEKTWRDVVHPGDLILVCDVGGGTSDFSLIAVTETLGELALERVAVGRHLLLGGDNMDLALAYSVKSELNELGYTLDGWQFLSLVYQCRTGKEVLFSDAERDSFPISIASRGASLFASTISHQLRRDSLMQIIEEGFFPMVELDSKPSRARSGFQELGLHYETDPTLTKHLAEFLRMSLMAASGKLRSLSDEHEALLTAAESRGALLPTHLLFNGGVFQAGSLRDRVTKQLREWGVPDLQVLSGTRLDLAVGDGAAYYGRLKALGEGIKVQAGTSSSYYLGLEQAALAVPGMRPEVKGLCLVPLGTEEGSKLSLSPRQFGLVVGEPVEFRFFASRLRPDDVEGKVAPTDNLEELALLAVTLDPKEGMKVGDLVAVTVETWVTEVGTLKVFLADVQSTKRWELELDARKSL